MATLSANSPNEEDDSYSSEETVEEDGTLYENVDDPVGSSSEEDSITHTDNEEEDTYDSNSSNTENDSPSDFDDESELY